MFHFVRFLVYAMRMRRSYYSAIRAKDEESTFQFLRKARQFGLAALQIQSPFIPQQVRAAMKKNLVAVHGLYQRGVIVRIPEEDLELVAHVLKTMKAWTDMGIAPNAHQVVSIVKEIEIVRPECAGKLRKWIPELVLFPEESPPQ